MNFLHYDFNITLDEIIEVTLDEKANVRLLDDANYANYKAGREHKYYGGRAKKSVVQLHPPRPGHWHVVIDLGGYSGTVSAAVRVIKEQQPV